MNAEASVYDLAVVGAGPGGSTAAALARQRGWRVVLIEKDRFPRFRIGESLLPTVNAILQRSGAWPKIEAAGFYPKYGGVFHTFDGAAAQEVDFRRSLVPGLESTFQVERARFDELLLNHAAELGAEVRLESRVEQVSRVSGGHELRCSSGGRPSTLRARWVFDAGGRLNAMRTGERRELERPRFPRRIALFSHFHGVRRAAGRSAGYTVVVRIQDGWFWLIPLDEQRTSVGLVESADRFAAARQTPEERFWARVEQTPKMRELMGDGGAQLPFASATDYSYFHRRLASDRFMRIGDAAGFFDPIFSSGVYLSLATAEMAVELAARADKAGRGLRPGEAAAYGRRVKRHARTFERLIAAFYDDPSFETFMSPEIPFNIRPGITAIVAGHSQLTWPLWWRYWLFLAACRLQHWRKMAPPLKLAPG